MTSSSSSSLRKDSLYLAVLFAKHQWQWRGIVTSSSSAAGKLEEQNKLRLLLLLQRRATLASASSVSLTRISASMNTWRAPNAEGSCIRRWCSSAVTRCAASAAAEAATIKSSWSSSRGATAAKANQTATATTWTMDSIFSFHGLNKIH